MTAQRLDFTEINMNKTNTTTSPLLVVLLVTLCVAGSCAVYPGFFTDNDYISVIVGAIVLLLAQFVLIKMYKGKKLRNIIAGGILVPVIIILGVKIRIDDYHTRQRNEEKREIWRVTQEAEERWDDLVVSAYNVCKGTGQAIQSAASYNVAIQEVHPILIINELTGEDLSSDYYEHELAWKPDSAEYLQLVACVKAGWITVETCQYYGGVAYRKQHDVKVSVYEAKSGVLIDTIRFSGIPPRQCGDTEVFFNDEKTKDIKGDPFSASALIYVLTPFVSP